jgi:glycosyltransferase involved in cell wall biosynthesis
MLTVPVNELDKKCVRFTYAGNIGKVQDVQCIIRATGRLREIPGFEVHIYGNGACFEECKALARDLDTEDKICFHGRVDREELEEEYRKTDAFLLTLKDEGFIGMTMPAKLQEYMSAGKPVIAAISGAAAQVIKDARCGLVSEPSNDSALADNMRKFLLDPGVYNYMGENGYKYYSVNFTLYIYMERLMNILQSLNGKEA